MAEHNSGVSRALSYCIMGLLAGLVFAAVFYVVADYEGTQAIFAGIVVAVVVPLLLMIMLRTSDKSAPGPIGHTDEKNPAQRAGSAPTAGTGTPAAPASAAAPTPQEMAPERSAPPTAGAAAAGVAASNVEQAESPARSAPTSETKAVAHEAALARDEPKVKPTTPLAGQSELSSRKGSWKYEGTGPEGAGKTVEPAQREAEVGKKVADAPEPSETAMKSAELPEPASAAPPMEGTGAEAEPSLMDAPQGGSADNLKLISGVGPKLEQTLNEMGIWHFHQVAAWGPQEIRWVDNRLRFKGRIERDDWISQAKILAEGGETEFSTRTKK
ncbi:MAG: endonuclease [Sulfitobacter sp.]|nr:endonuclease [Sulfitobacter sp.]